MRAGTIFAVSIVSMFGIAGCVGYGIFETSGTLPVAAQRTTPTPTKATDNPTPSARPIALISTAQKTAEVATMPAAAVLQGLAIWAQNNMEDIAIICPTPSKLTPFYSMEDAFNRLTTDESPLDTFTDCNPVGVKANVIVLDHIGDWIAQVRVVTGRFAETGWTDIRRGWGLKAY